jgi:hypothetical protein
MTMRSGHNILGIGNWVAFFLHRTSRAPTTDASVPDNFNSASSDAPVTGRSCPSLDGVSELGINEQPEHAIRNFIQL